MIIHLTAEIEIWLWGAAPDTARVFYTILYNICAATFLNFKKF